MGVERLAVRGGENEAAVLPGGRFAFLVLSRGPELPAVLPPRPSLWSAPGRRSRSRQTGMICTS